MANSKWLEWAKELQFLSQCALAYCKDRSDIERFERIREISAVIRDGKILLVQESNGSWALPGGWVDYDQTPRSNAVKEVFEEAGMTVRPLRLIALYEHNRRNTTRFPYNICCAYVLCEYLSGDFRPNIETVACDFFAPGELPAPLAENKTTREQIEMCFRAAKDKNWQVEFD